MAALIAVSRNKRRRLRSFLYNEYRLKDIENPFDVDDRHFIKTFRLSKDAVIGLCDRLRPQMSSSRYSVEMQVLSSLQILASGSFQYNVSNSIFTYVSQSSVSRFFEKFLDAVMSIRGDFISFPTEAAELMAIKSEFRNKTGFPNCIGAIDCTHVKITRPMDFDWFVFINRKNDFSINVQMVCDFNQKILDVVARWPGSTHDSFIWSHSGLKEVISTRIPPANFLIGDSGYPLQPWLLTPYGAEDTPGRRRFNVVHRRARNVIERCFGVLKSRFRSLHETGGNLMYTPAKVCKIVTVCAILHNLCLEYNMDFDEPILYDDSVGDDESPPTYNNQNLRNIGRNYRDQISLNL